MKGEAGNRPDLPIVTWVGLDSTWFYFVTVIINFCFGLINYDDLENYVIWIYVQSCCQIECFVKCNLFDDKIYIQIQILVKVVTFSLDE